MKKLLLKLCALILLATPLMMIETRGGGGHGGGRGGHGGRGWHGRGWGGRGWGRGYGWGGWYGGFGYPYYCPWWNPYCWY